MEESLSGNIMWHDRFKYLYLIEKNKIEMNKKRRAISPPPNSKMVLKIGFQKQDLNKMMKKLISNRELAIDTLNNTLTEKNIESSDMSPDVVKAKENEKLMKLMSMYTKQQPNNIGK